MPVTNEPDRMIGIYDDSRSKQVPEPRRGLVARRPVESGGFIFSKPEQASGIKVRQTETMK